MKWYVLIVFLFIVTSKEKSLDNESRKSLKENRTKVAKILKKAQDSGV